LLEDDGVGGDGRVFDRDSRGGEAFLARSQSLLSVSRLSPTASRSHLATLPTEWELVAMFKLQLRLANRVVLMSINNASETAS
jgi:hypothetical protein